MTKTPSLDPNLLAALIDGRLDPAQAEHVRKQMSAADDDTLSAYADAMLVAAELSDTEVPIAGSLGGNTLADLPAEDTAPEDAPPATPKDENNTAIKPAKEASPKQSATTDVVNIHSVKPAKSSRGWRVWMIPALAAAAALSFVMVQTKSTSNDVVAINLPATAPIPEQPWSATRGAGDDQSDVSRAARTGVLVTNALALRGRGDSIASTLRALESTVQGALGGQIIASEFGKLRTRSGAPIRNEEIEKLAREAFGIVGRPVAQVGAFLQLVRICLSTPDAALFESTVPGQIPDDKIVGSLNPTQQAALKGIIAKIGQSPRDYVAIDAETNQLLRELTR